MQNVLTDLAIEAEASTWTAMRMAMAFDASYNENPSLVSCTSAEESQELFRIGVTVSKYHVTKRLPQFTYECMEVSDGSENIIYVCLILVIPRIWVNIRRSKWAAMVLSKISQWRNCSVILR
jgi:hypothetical protein